MGLEDRKAELRKEIERKTRYLGSLEEMPDFNVMEEGSIVALTVTFGTSRPYPMIAYKVDGFWFVTGKSGPAGISSDGLAEWLITQGRQLLAATLVAEFTIKKPEPIDIGAAMATAMRGLRNGDKSRLLSVPSMYDGRYGYPDGV